MLLKTKVKAGNITNLSDARYCAGMGVDWLGFPAKSVNPKTFTEITSWVTGPQFIVEFDTDTAPDSLYDYGVELIQIESKLLSTIQPVSFKDFELLIVLALPTWVAVKDQLKEINARIPYLVVRDLSGNYEQDKFFLKEIANTTDVLLDVASSQYTLEQILEFPIAGLNLAGNTETKPGLKDYTQLSEILEKLEID